MKINLGHMVEATTAMGPGTRACIWVRGCSIGCAGCATPQYWSREPVGLVAISEIVDRLVAAHATHGLEGISFSGGEPFEQAPVVAAIARAARGLGLSTLSWSGYTLEFLRSEKAPEGARELIEALDVLIDGAYLRAQASDVLPLRGSANQRIHFLTPRYSETDIGPRRAVLTLQDATLTTHGVADYPRLDAVLQLLGATRPPNPA